MFGTVLITHLGVICDEDLTGASATIELGADGNTAALVAQTPGTNLDAGEIWNGTSPPLGVGTAVVDKVVNDDIILTVGTDVVDGGKIRIWGYYLPMSVDGNIAS